MMTPEREKELRDAPLPFWTVDDARECLDAIAEMRTDITIRDKMLDECGNKILLLKSENKRLRAVVDAVTEVTIHSEMLGPRKRNPFWHDVRIVEPGKWGAMVEAWRVAKLAALDAAEGRQT